MRRFKPVPLPPNPTFIDRLEYGIQWLVSWFIIHDPDHPLISGVLTGLLLMVPVIGLATLFMLLFGALTKLFQ